MRNVVYYDIIVHFHTYCLIYLYIFLCPCVLLVWFCVHLSPGGCKHSIAVVSWIHRRCEEPSPTEVDCYWKKGCLSSLASNNECVCAKDIGKSSSQGPKSILRASDGSESFLQETVRIASQEPHLDCLLVNQFRYPLSSASMHKLITEFVTCTENCYHTADKFYAFIQQEVHEINCDNIAQETKENFLSATWCELHYGRITASVRIVKHLMGA